MAFKQQIAQHEPCVGTWVTFGDPAISELLGQAGFDFLLYDMEHAPISLESLQNHFMALNGMAIPAIVRLPRDDPSYAKWVLDIGASGVLIPNVHTAADVRQAVEHAKYPPQGVRGIGPRRPGKYGREVENYIAAANEDVIIIAQIENRTAVRNAEEILQVEGLSGIFFGPNDLSADMGLFPQTSHPDVVAAMDRVTQEAIRQGVPVGQWSLDAEAAREWAQKGVAFTVLSMDYIFLANSVDKQVAGTRKVLEEVAARRSAEARASSG
jgi:2-keto-3-deoxy-L-rhamnonate aldolase RhmA